MQYSFHSPIKCADRPPDNNHSSVEQTNQTFWEKKKQKPWTNTLPLVTLKPLSRNQYSPHIANLGNTYPSLSRNKKQLTSLLALGYIYIYIAGPTDPALPSTACRIPEKMEAIM